MIDDTVYEPLKQFESEYKEKVNEEAINTYENLLKESKIDINQNEMSVKKYNETVAKNEKVKDKLTRYKVYRALLYPSCYIIHCSYYIFCKRLYNS